MNSSITQIITQLRAQANEIWPEAPPKDFRIVRHLVRPYSEVYRLQLVAPAIRFVYVKILTPGAKFEKNPEKYLTRLATEFNAARRLQTALQNEAEIAVIKPLAYFPEWLAIITAEASGVTLAELINREGRFWPAAEKLEQLTKHCRRAGQALATMQKVTAEAARFDPTGLLEYIDERLQRLVKSEETPLAATDRQQIIKFLEHAIAAIPMPQLGLCGTHGDYAPFNVLATAEKITVADFTMFKAGSVYNDLTYFYHRLEGYLHKPVFRPATVQRLQEAFVAGYGAAMGNSKSPPGNNDVLFKIFWIKHIVNNYSAIMRRRVLAKGKTPSWPVQLFNRHVFQRYNRCLQQFCNV